MTRPNFSLWGRRRGSRQERLQIDPRSLRLEQLEDRRVLATMADIVFIVDESGSDQNTGTQAWIAKLIAGVDLTGDGDRNDPGEVMSLAEQLSDAGIDDLRYGLIGFGEGVSPPDFDIPRFAHSQLMVSGDPSSLLINPAGNDGTLGTGDDLDVESIVGNLVQQGSRVSEDGLDGIEHAIAEYVFRNEAVPIFVLVQADQGRLDVNDTLTRDGILAALQSKSVILNSVVVGDLLVNGQPLGPNDPDPEEPLTVPPGAEFDWTPLFDFSRYEASTNDYANRYVLGVESDGADGVYDRQHDIVVFDTVGHAIVDAVNLPATESDALQVTFNGSNTGASGMVGTGKSVLISQNIGGGLGGQTGDPNSYRADSVPIAPVDMSSATVQPLNTAVTFTFPFFGSSKTQLWVRQDGTISFSDGNPGTPADPGAANADLTRPPQSHEPALPTDPIIAVLWDDLEEAFSGGLTGRVLKRTANLDNDSLTDLALQWTDYRYNTDGSTIDPISFQAVLYGNGDIHFNYIDLDSYPNTGSEFTVEDTGGIDATVGIWSGAADGLTLPAGKYVPGPHSLFTDSSGETADSYIRMAWDTGGAAWDVGVVDRYGASSPEANALASALTDSLVSQIQRARAHGGVFREDQVLLALNLGHTIADVDAGTAGLFRADDGVFTAPVNGGPDTGAAAVDSFTDSDPVNVSSTNSIPAGTASALEDVFQSARGGSLFAGASDMVSFSIDKLDDGTGTATAFPNGKYVVELFFADIENDEFGSVSRSFDVLLEQQTVLNDYDILSDHARIVSFDSDELDAAATGVDVGLVKRFLVAVRGGDGLQIDLLSEIPDVAPILNAVRILEYIDPSADFNQDGDVDGNDFLAWQRGFGMMSGATRADGDADGDGDVDAMDLEIWSSQYGGPSDPDFNGDGVVNSADLGSWQSSFGVDDGGDADGDGDTDGHDFLLWQRAIVAAIPGAMLASSIAVFLQPDPGIIFVTSTDDEVDGDYTLGNLSLREAVQIANDVGTAMTIILPAGHYELDLTGAEAGDGSYNDLDITGDIRIAGDGAGLTVIDGSALSGSHGRLFDVVANGARLELSGVTLTKGGALGTSGGGFAVQLTYGTTLELTDSAVVNHNAYGVGAIQAIGADVTVRRSVFTNNTSNYTTPALEVNGSYGSASLTIGQSIFALNQGGYYSATDTVRVTGAVTKVNEGYNLYDDASGGFFDTTPGTGDYLGTPDYVVTSAADTFDHTDDDDALSLREAIDLANTDSGASEVWLPAWTFVLTRDRATYGTGTTDVDVSFGDLDITDSLVVRGVSGQTAVQWTAGVNDAVFDLIGDFNQDGQADQTVSGSDYLAWQTQNGSGSVDPANWEQFSADADDDGDVDSADQALWSAYYGNTLELFDMLA